MIHLDTAHRIAVICILLFGIAVCYITFFTRIFINWQQIASLPKLEISKAIPLWVSLIGALGLACVVFAVDVLFIRRGFFR